MTPATTPTSTTPLESTYFAKTKEYWNKPTSDNIAAKVAQRVFYTGAAAICLVVETLKAALHTALGYFSAKKVEELPAPVATVTASSSPASPVTVAATPVVNNWTKVTTFVREKIWAAAEKAKPHVYSALGVGKFYANAAMEKAQPYIDALEKRAKPHMDYLAATGKPYLDKVKSHYSAKTDFFPEAAAVCAVVVAGAIYSIAASNFSKKGSF